MLLLAAAAVRRFFPRPSAGGMTTTLRTIYDGANAWADFGNTNVLQTRYLFTRAIDEVLARLSSTSILAWDLPDLLGSVRDISDGAGTAVLDHVKYDSYGNILSESSPSSGDRFKYTAREWDAATSQYFYRARYYSSTAGRFTSQDPLKFAGGNSNTFAIELNTPTIFTDPSGEHIVVVDPSGTIVNGVPNWKIIENALQELVGKQVAVDPMTGRVTLPKKCWDLPDLPDYVSCLEVLDKSRNIYRIEIVPDGISTYINFPTHPRTVLLPISIIPPVQKTTWADDQPVPLAPRPLKNPAHLLPITLVHELGHAVQHERGQKLTGHDLNSPPILAENAARKTLGEAPRPPYPGGQYVPITDSKK